MIALTILNLKSKKISIEVYGSLDKARDKLATLITNPEKIVGLKKGEYLDGYSADNDAERALIEGYLPESRLMKGGEK